MNYKFAIGQHVRVAITKPNDWARGCAEVFNGKLGIIEAQKGRTDWEGGGPYYLVHFDEPAPPTWTHGSPHTGFHFDEYDLQEVTCVSDEYVLPHLETRFQFTANDAALALSKKLQRSVKVYNVGDMYYVDGLPLGLTPFRVVEIEYIPGGSPHDGSDRKLTEVK